MSFYHAFDGICSSIRAEAHLRFHIAVANLIIVFAYFFGITRAEWAILILDIAAVIAAELMNTAVERAVDTATHERVQTAKLAKDAAAGAVLILAAASVAVGVCLFGDAGKIMVTLANIFNAPHILIPCLILGAADILFVACFKE